MIWSKKGKNTSSFLGSISILFTGVFTLGILLFVFFTFFNKWSFLSNLEIDLGRYELDQIGETNKFLQSRYYQYSGVKKISKLPIVQDIRESLDRFNLVHGLDSCLDLEFDRNLWSLRKKAYVDSKDILNIIYLVESEENVLKFRRLHLLEFGGLYLLDMELQ